MLDRMQAQGVEGKGRPRGDPSWVAVGHSKIEMHVFEYKDTQVDLEGKMSKGEPTPQVRTNKVRRLGYIVGPPPTIRIY